jgi:hypothetical protein
MATNLSHVPHFFSTPLSQTTPTTMSSRALKRLQKNQLLDADGSADDSDDDDDQQVIAAPKKPFNPFALVYRSDAIKPLLFWYTRTNRVF